MKKISFDQFDKCMRIGFAIIIAGCFLFIITGMFAIFYPDPPEPQIKYGEFPFKITYEVNGEVRIYEDVIICEFAGVKSLGTGGKKNEWTARLKSGKDYVVLLQSTDDNSYLEIYDSIPGSAEYYMGDFWLRREDYEKNMQSRRNLICNVNGIEASITYDEAWEKYGFKIIDIEYSPPIENTFVEKDK